MSVSASIHSARAALSRDRRVRRIVSEIGDDFVIETEFDEPSELLAARVSTATGTEVRDVDDIVQLHSPREKLAVLPQEELVVSLRGQIIDWRSRDSGFPDSLASTLARAAESRSGGLVTIDQDGAVVERDWRELLLLAEQGASSLRASAMVPGTKAVLVATSPDDMLVAFWSAILADVEPVLIPAGGDTDANHLATTLQSLRKLLGPLVMLSGADGPGVPESVTGVAVVRVRSTIDAVLPSSDRAPEAHSQLRPHSTRHVYFMTSGSTGSPKVVPQSHAAILNVAAGSAMVNRIDSDAVSLNWMPLSHVGGILMTHVRDVLAGCRHISVDTDRILADPIEWFRIIDQYKVTATWSPNFALRLLTRAARSSKDHAEHYSLASLRFYLNGGEPIAHDDVREFYRELSPFGLHGDCVTPAWGMSETCSGVLYNTHYDPNNTETLPSVGFPLPNISVRIIAEDLASINSQQGRLEVRGSSVFEGYPGLDTTGTVRDGWFQTGDVASFDPRHGIAICGRDDSRITVNGVTRTTAELEALVESVYGVAPRTAAVAEDGTTVRPRIVVFCAVRSGAQDAMTERIRSAVWEATGISIDRVIIVPQSEIEWTPIGKIKRGLLVDRYLGVRSDRAIAASFESELQWAPLSEDARDFLAEEIVRFESGRLLPCASGPDIHLVFEHSDLGEASGKLHAKELAEVLAGWEQELNSLDSKAKHVSLVTVVIRGEVVGAGSAPLSHPVAAFLRAQLNDRGVSRVRTLWVPTDVPDTLVEEGLRTRGLRDLRIDPDGNWWHRVLHARKPPVEQDQPSPEHVVLIGGGGRLGSSLAQQYRNNGSLVTVVGRRSSSVSQDDRGPFLKADLATSKGQAALVHYLRDIASPANIHLIHLAGSPHAGAEVAGAFEGILYPKIDVLAGALAIATDIGSRLTVISSVNAHFAGAGLSYYAAACAAAECLISAQSGRSRVISVSAVERASSPSAIAELSGLGTVPIGHLISVLSASDGRSRLVGVAPVNRFQNAEGAQQVAVTLGENGSGADIREKKSVSKGHDQGTQGISASAIVATLARALDEVHIREATTWLDAGISSVELPMAARSLSIEFALAVTLVDMMRYPSPESLAAALSDRRDAAREGSD